MILIAFFIVTIASFANFFVGYSFGMSDYQKEAVEKGYAEYNSKTGKWQWK